MTLAFYAGDVFDTGSRLDIVRW